MKTTWLIGWECKSSNVLSGPVLISRGLDLLRIKQALSWIGESGGLIADRGIEVFYAVVRELSMSSSSDWQIELVAKSLKEAWQNVGLQLS